MAGISVSRTGDQILIRSENSAGQSSEIAVTDEDARKLVFGLLRNMAAKSEGSLLESDPWLEVHNPEIELGRTEGDAIVLALNVNPVGPVFVHFSKEAAIELGTELRNISIDA